MKYPFQKKHYKINFIMYEILYYLLKEMNFMGIDN